MTAGTIIATYILLGFSFSSVYTIFSDKLFKFQYFFRPNRNIFGAFEFVFFIVAWPFVLIELTFGIILQSIFNLGSLISLRFIVDGLYNYIDWLKGMRAK